MTIMNLLRKIVGVLLPESIALKGKRVIFMTTFYLKMCQNSGIPISLEECNRQLGLVDDVDALKLPAALKNTVWKSNMETSLGHVTEAINNGDTSTINQVVIGLTPAWLRYDASSCNMQTDIETIVSCVSQRHAAML
jgi:hypothetical protein